MHEDRYNVNKPMYILGVITLLIGAGLIFFALYLIPHFLWNIDYELPEWVMTEFYRMQQEWEWTPRWASWGVFLWFFIPGAVLLYISQYINKRLEAELESSLKLFLQSKAENKKIHRSFFWLLLMIILLIVAVLWGIGEVISW
jgi:hypothetical protein